MINFSFICLFHLPAFVKAFSDTLLMQYMELIIFYHITNIPFILDKFKQTVMQEFLNSKRGALEIFI